MTSCWCPIATARDALGLDGTSECLTSASACADAVSIWVHLALVDWLVALASNSASLAVSAGLARAFLLYPALRRDSILSLPSPDSCMYRLQ
jgi:hypothetical protein